MARLLENTRTRSCPQLLEQAGTKNPMAVPRLDKIVISMGVGRRLGGQEAAGAGRPRTWRSSPGRSRWSARPARACRTSRSAPASETGLKVTLRGKRMYEFLDRLISMSRSRVFATSAG